MPEAPPQRVNYPSIAVNTPTPTRCELCGGLRFGDECTDHHQAPRSDVELLEWLGILFRRKPERFAVMVLRVTDPGKTLEEIGVLVGRLLNKPRPLSRQAVQQHSARIRRQYPSLSGYLSYSPNTAGTA